jgi:hypothetical protein
MRWDAFEQGCPEIATIARERFTLTPSGASAASSCTS